MIPEGFHERKRNGSVVRLQVRHGYVVSAVWSDGESVLRWPAPPKPSKYAERVTRASR